MAKIATTDVMVRILRDGQIIFSEHTNYAGMMDLNMIAEDAVMQHPGCKVYVSALFNPLNEQMFREMAAEKGMSPEQIEKALQ